MTEWTPDLLKEHFESRLEGLEKRIEQRFVDSQTAVQAALSAAEKNASSALASQKEAVIKAETSNEKRFSSLNEIRGAMMDLQRTFLPRAEGEANFKAISEKIEGLKEQINESKSQRVAVTANAGGVKDGWGLAVGVVFFVIAVVVFVTKFTG